MVGCLHGKEMRSGAVGPIGNFLQLFRQEPQNDLNSNSCGENGEDWEHPKYGEKTKSMKPEE